MADDDEWKKLPTEQKVQHKSWKARSEGYKECLKKFGTLDEKNPEFSKYLGHVKKFVVDSNELVRVQGLEVTLVFVQNAAVAGKTSGEVVSGIISKCFNSKPRLRELGIQVCLMYVEIDRNEQVMEEALKGLENKQPKVVHACLDLITTALSEFGSKVIAVKPLLKPCIKLLDHRDKNVREATKSLFVTMYRWIGPAIKAPLQGINAVMLKELEDGWERVASEGSPHQTRFMRSQQDLREKMEAKQEAQAASGEGASEEVEAEVEVDPYDLTEPVEILSKLPKKFFEDIEAKKWQDRRMMLEECEKLVSVPKLVPDDYGDLVKALKKVLSKDTNILLVVIAIKCISAMALGLRKKFQPYSHVCIDGMLERFKEKKANVVAALQEATDSVYATTNLPAIIETCVEYLGHKNPAIRAQTGLFMARALAKTKAAVLNKATIKILVPPLLKNIEHSTPDVRDAAFLCFGTILKVAGEGKLMPFIADLDKLKMDKVGAITESAEKVAGKPAASAAPSKPTAPAPAKSEPARPKSAAPTKSVINGVEIFNLKKNMAEKGGQRRKETKASSFQVSNSKGSCNKCIELFITRAVEQELGEAAAEDLVATVISEEEKNQILNNNWKERLAGLQALFGKIKGMPPSSIPCQALVKLLIIKPGLKDNNFNCLNEKFNIIAYMAQNGTFSRTSAGLCLTLTTDKVGDIKCGAAAKEMLTAVSEAAGFGWAVEEVLAHSMAQKNPKIQSESISWVATSIVQFGMAGLNAKLVIEKAKVAFTATNPAVRAAALSLVGSLALFIGEKLRMLFENEKPALLQQIDAEIEKVKGQSPPAPTRGIKKKNGSLDVEEQSDEDAEEPGLSMDDLVTRVDISEKITDALITQMADKNWKERKEALNSVIEILNEAKVITANIGDLTTSLKARLSDSNKILLTTTLNILTQLASAMGPHCAKHLQILSASMINVLADSKPQVRQAALKCMNAWLENTKMAAWLEGDMISSALSVQKNIFLRIELLSWLAEKLVDVRKLPPSAKEGLEMCIPVILGCCEDRSGEVRAKAQGFLPVIMRHISYDKMVRGTSKLTPTSKTAILTLLDKAREQIPAPPPAAAKPSKPAPSVAPPKEQVVEVADEPPVKQTAPAKEKKGLVTFPYTSKHIVLNFGKPAPTSRKAPPEEDTTPMFIALPNGKEQRMKDEAKLKTIKWHFNVPRDELIVQLQGQLSTCVSPSLITEMFHMDFQHHLKAIVMLNQALETNFDSTVQCLDILLRWLTLRFYDKNTTVHIKTLEYIKSLFDKLIQSNYRMTEYEVSAFLPHLIIKIGESKDNIRKAVHGIIKQLTLVYPASKLFLYIMDGTKSKNSRQRSECLDEVALLIETYGVNVCQPSLPKALKEVATNIGDRDKSVRSSALNAIVAAYNVCGDVVFKHVGRLNEKDMSMLEERVKRSGKFGEAPTNPEPQAPAPAKKQTKEPRPQAPSLPNPQTNTANSLESMSDLHSSASSHNDPVTVSIQRIMSQIQPIDFDRVLEPLPEIVVPSMLPGFNSAKANSVVDMIISQVACININTAITAMHELYEILKHKDKHHLLEGKVDQLFMSSTAQLRLMLDSNCMVWYEIGLDRFILCFFTIILSEIFELKSLASEASSYILLDLFRFILHLLLSTLLSKLSEADRMTEALNRLVLRILENCDPTAIMCAVMNVLTDSIESAPVKFIELVVKCLWKLGRLIHETLNPVAPVLQAIDKFWSSYPKEHPVYDRFENKITLRSVKTLLIRLSTELGVKIMEELYLIKNPESSMVVRAIRKTCGAENVKIPARSSSSEQKENIRDQGVSPDAQLAAIFKKVSDRQQTKNGLHELYDFKMANPDYDLESKISSLPLDIFQEYIRRGLEKIEKEKKT
uniref:TOG domain-containing protein n=1 Tax=Ciona savignyi TaxID=51511 RepID=H2Z394_CIOSA